MCVRMSIRGTELPIMISDINTVSMGEVSAVRGVTLGTEVQTRKK